MDFFVVRHNWIDGRLLSIFWYAIESETSGDLGKICLSFKIKGPICAPRIKRGKGKN